MEGGGIRRRGKKGMGRRAAKTGRAGQGDRGKAGSSILLPPD